MLYLAGQIILFVLVALVVGGAIGWILMAAPLRRRAADAQRRAEQERERAAAAEQDRERLETELATRPSEPATLLDDPEPAVLDDGEPATLRDDDEPAAAPPPRTVIGEADALAELRALLDRRQSEAEKERADLQAQLAEADEQRVALRREVREAEQRNAKVSSQLVAARMDAEAAPRPLPVRRDLENALATSEREKAELAARLSEAEGQVAALTTRIGAVDAEADRTEAGRADVEQADAEHTDAGTTANGSGPALVAAADAATATRVTVPYVPKDAPTPAHGIPLPEDAPDEAGVDPDGVTDDLKEIVGIGPVTAGRLAEFGFRRFGQLAVLTPYDCRALAQELGPPVSADDVRFWVTQAGELRLRQRLSSS